MRILYTHSSSLVGGGNKVVLSLLSSLDRAEYEPFSVLPAPGPMEEELRRRNVPFVIQDLRPGRGRAAVLRSLASLAFYVVRHKVDLLHANDPWTYRMAAVALRGSKQGRVCHVHHPGQIAGAARWAFARMPDLVMTPSELVREEVCAALGSAHAGKVEKVGNPIDVEWFSPAPDRAALREGLGLEERGPHISILGALMPHKGHDAFIRMAARVKRVHPNASFHIVGSAKTGDAQWASQLKQMVDDTGLSDAVRFWGFVPDDAARDILRASDLFVLPTREEGFCLVVAEAQACGVPVITSAIRPLDELVVDGKTGWLVAPGDHDAFAVRALELLESTDRHARVSADARAFVVERFAHTAYARRITAAYDGLYARLRSKGQPAPLIDMTIGDRRIAASSRSISSQ